MADDEQGTSTSLRRVDTLSGKELCEGCDRLELSGNKFLVSNAGRSLPHSRSIKSRFILNSGLGKTSHGKIREIEQRVEKGGCALCQLIFEAVRRYSGENVDDSSECFMVWEVDGRQAARQPGLAPKHNVNDKDDTNMSLSNVSRRLKIWWTQKDGSEMDAYILFLASSDKVSTHTDTNFNLQDPRQSVFLGRDFDVAEPKSALFKSWLDTCENLHKSRSCDKNYFYDPAGFFDLGPATWFGVIDVIRMRICRLPWDMENKKPSRYIALSYVWGEGEHPHRTIRKNMPDRIKPGGIEENSLPYTIRKAIQLTRDIGEKYIWIDSLCIVQDSDFSWGLNADVMDLVYGNAYLTICAADGQNDKAGLHALDLETADTPLKAELRNGLRLLVSRPSESIIRDSIWNQRGWTFQERILSRRCLVFAGGRVYFQCRSGNTSQDIAPDTSGQGLSMDWKTSPLRILDELKERPIWFYMTSVSLYTGRRLTKAKDILAAYKGVSKLITQHIQGPMDGFVYGLPPSHFDLALLWSPLKAQTRRKPSSKQDAKEIDLPSWSWAGWKDPHDEKKGSPVKYQQDMLDGCLIDTHEWLSEHTWIKWFIRNSRGDLRPIWDKWAMPKVEGVLARWRGYATNAPPYLPSMLYRHRTSNPSDDESTNISMQGAKPAIPPTREVHHDPDLGMHLIEVRQHHPPQRNRISRVEPPQHEYDYPPRNEISRVEPPQNEYDPPHRDETSSVESLHRHGDDIASEPELLNIPGVTEHITGQSMPTTETEETESTMTERPESKDEYGRRVRWRKEQAKSASFSLSIPDNPFGVYVVHFLDRIPAPDRPILQFWTWRARFYVVHNESATEASPPGEGLVRCDIADVNADWCGHIVLNETYIKAKESNPMMNFIALSEAKSFTKEECRNWAHYIPTSFEDIEWDLFFVMLIEWGEDSVAWERVGLGKIVQAAFHGSTWEEIVLG